MKRPHFDSPPLPKRKKRRGRRKSKAERLARITSEPKQTDDLFRLLNDYSSCKWDAAQSLALRMGTPDARAMVVRIILIKHKAPRAAAHYAKRLDMQNHELLNAVLSNSSPSSLAPLLLAQFLVELDETSLATEERLNRFLWPWLLQIVEQQAEIASVKAAVHLLLHPTSSDDAKVQEKKEQGRKLERALVTKCLKEGKLLHLVPPHALAFADRMSVCSSIAHEDEKTDLKFEETIDVEMQRRFSVAHHVQEVLRLMWPDTRVFLFGSSVTGFLSTFVNDEFYSPDVDLCALLPSSPQFRQDTAPLITEIKEHLNLYFSSDMTEDSEQVTAVTRARVPIVHFVDPSTNLLCDLCVNNVSALWNTRLLRRLLYGGADITTLEQQQLVHVRHFCKWIRKWRRIKKRAVGGALSSYGLMLLAIYYLQRISVLPVLDCSTNAVEDELTLRTLTEEELDKRIQATDTVFVDANDKCQVVRHWQTLRRGFFRFYTCEFDYEQTIVSLRTKELMYKTSKGWSRQKNTRLCLEDPIEIERDLGLLCSKRALGRLRCAFAHACIVLSKAEENEDLRDLETNLLASWKYEDENA
ncbi:S-M checkpoint control protein CID1 and related nucleotidyltransferases [Plasmopara halstedii]|uniref:S-M checkpoint control protein CID1 and related nucleotidyltransferases n=1 Tax=Plasmopara halstedii TaxID=4781 RepID=A0A0N7L8J2_PLAHL|nr:S-M checkpoint control protein CID1 and related nucleotidyltransferases [Plasmopara halstedii]CEG50027.1 S-M checkpoint control protein CID1 and related nucleotidyltransferases [Plasmopara halstedii]|eukprot:XP_024586396.1 S-M checkpoint control protein CID1 and related nucleotidyltransferases [Plasmopara halstedii]